MSDKELFPWAQHEADDFYRRYRDGNCSCHISPPCGLCTHPGNPRNLEETEDAWGFPAEVALAYLDEDLRQFISDLAKRHLAEMRASWRAAT